MIDLSADFRIRERGDLPGILRHEHPAPELLGDAVYGLPEIYRDKIRDAQTGGVSRLLSDEHSVPAIPLVAREG